MGLCSHRLSHILGDGNVAHRTMEYWSVLKGKEIPTYATTQMLSEICQSQKDTYLYNSIYMRDPLEANLETESGMVTVRD